MMRPKLGNHEIKARLDDQTFANLQAYMAGYRIVDYAKALTAILQDYFTQNQQVSISSTDAVLDRYAVGERQERELREAEIDTDELAEMLERT